MLTVNDIHKTFGDNIVLQGASLIVNKGDRLGLVGPNGCGKTTLLRIIAGRDMPDRGSVTATTPGLRIGYLEQALTCPPDATVGQVILHQVGQAEQEVERLSVQMALASGSELARLMQAWSVAMDRLEAAGGYAAQAQMEAVLSGLGLDRLGEHTPVDILSGGQKTRLGLARLLLQRPQLLLLDEPTNHLDIEALEWLEKFLTAYDGAVLIVSHDRTFLDRTVTAILELDAVTHAIRVFAGNYTHYAAQKQAERERHWQDYVDQQDEIARLRSAVNRLRGQTKMKRGGKGDSGDKFARGFFSDQTSRTAAKSKSIERRIEHLLTDEHVDKPGLTWQMKFNLAGVPPISQDVLMIEQLAMRFGSLTLFEQVNLTLRAGERVVLTGPNGSGKTTLLRIIMGQLEPMEGQVRLGASVRVGYYSQEQEGLDPQADVLTEIRRVAALGDTEARSFLHYFLFSGDDVFVPVGALSFGERARLALARLVAAGCNFLVLDEPINHLDISSREQFEQGLSQFSGAVLAVVHDRYFIERFATRLWAVHNGNIRSFVDLQDMKRGIS